MRTYRNPRSADAVGAAITFVLMVVSGTLAGPPSDPPAEIPQIAGKSGVTLTAPEEVPMLRIGPSRARFVCTPGGTWLGFGAREGRALISNGGFVVTSQGSSGARTLLDTRSGEAIVLDGFRSVGVAHEGVRGGTRAPSSRPDDDGDGAVDEDRLDGTDNDNDGRVDEDFAAAGDAMVVTGYRNAAGDDAVVEVYQESFAWTLPHIDGVIVTRVTIRNVGSNALKGVRAGAVFERRGDVAIATHVVASGDAAEADDLMNKAVLLRSADATGAVVFFAPAQTGEASWLTGVARDDRTITSLVDVANRADATGRDDQPGLSAGASRREPLEDAAGTPRTEMVYGISPDLGALQPGESVEMYVAFVLAASDERAARAVDDAWRTVIGDGQNRLIPPPVSITRRVVWGNYELRVPDDASAGVSILLEAPKDAGVDPRAISYLKGVDLRAAIRTELTDGNTRIQLSGDALDAFNDNERVVLYGRLNDGEWFDIVLEPVAPLTDSGFLPGEVYFSRGGKLDEALLSGSPNPFRESTTIRYEIPSRMVDEQGNEYEFNGAVDATVKVYNVAGRLVSTLNEAQLSPGVYETHWNATNDTGGLVASGVYYVKLQLGSRFVTKRLTQLR